METSKFLEMMNDKKGQYAQATWSSVVKTPAKSSDVVIKTTTATVRTGIAYSNLTQNADKETGPLPWGEWLVFPFVVTHNGNDYARLYLAESFQVTQTFTLNGVPCTKEEAQAVTLPSAWNKKSDGPTLTFTVKMENVEMHEKKGE